VTTVAHAELGRVLVVRHRESTWNAQRRWAGQEDPPLTAVGEAQAAEMATVLAPFGFEAIVSSDLVRAARTAELVAAASPTSVLRQDPRLREIDVPPWTGLTKDEIEGAYPGALERWRGDVPQPPAGSEPWPDFERRVVDALADCARRAPTTLVVAHSGVLRVLRTALGSPHGKVGRSRGVWLEPDGEGLRVGALERLKARAG
jgi:broad specificity phosphatase PhoE